jgi:hypothetical protein
VWKFPFEPFAVRETNHHAIAGFLLPFCATGIAAWAVLAAGEDRFTLIFDILFLGVIPVILIGGLIFSLRSIPLIAQRGDKDYAYSGLTLNILFILMYLLSLFYFFK